MSWFMPQTGFIIVQPPTELFTRVYLVRQVMAALLITHFMFKLPKTFCHHKFYEPDVWRHKVLGNLNIR